MLNANNKVNYEPSIKQKEKKYSLSTVLAWLYLKTIGRILPGRWNQWAKNILYYNKIIADNGVQTDNLLNSNREKELKDENERLKEKLKEGSKKEENQSNLNQELTKKEKEITKLKEQVKSLVEEKEIFAKFFAEQAQQIEDLELESNVLKEEKEQLNSIIKDLKKDYRELAEIAQKRGEEFLAQFKEKSEEILHLQKELIECSKEFANKIEMLSVRVEKKDGKIRSLTELNKTLEQEKKEMENKNNAQQQIILDQKEKIDKQGALITSLTDKNKDINETVKEDNESLRAQNTDLESKVSQLKNEFDTQIKQLESQLEEKQAELEQAKKKNTELEDLKKCLEKDKSDSSNKLSAAKKEKKELEDEVKELKEQVEKKDDELEGLKQQLKKDKSDWEDKLNASKEEKKDLEDEVKELKEQAKGKDAEVENLKQQLEKEKDELKDSSNKLSAAKEEKKDLEDEVKELKEQAKKKDAELEDFRTRLEKEKIDLEGKLKDSSSKLNTAEIEKKDLESEVDKLQEKLKSSQGKNKKLQEQVEHLSAEQEKAKSVAVLSITDSTKTFNENLTLKNQQIESSIAEDGPQELKEKSNNVDTKLEGIDEKTKEQAKAKALDTASVTKSTNKSTLSKLQNLSNKIFRDKSLNNFLSDQNAKLKEGFPEFEGKHFCHNVLDETIKSLSNQSDGKFESNKLLALLKENLVKSGKAIIETKVNKVVEKLAKDHVKKYDLKQVIFVEECAKKLKTTQADYQAELTSIVNSWSEMNCRDNDSAKKFVVQKLTEAKMKCFSDKVQQLASSIRDKFLSPDQEMCNQTQGGVNEYQLTEKAKKEYKLTLNSSMSHTNNLSYGLADKERHRNRRLFGLHGVGNQNRKNMN